VDAVADEEVVPFIVLLVVPVLGLMSDEVSHHIISWVLFKSLNLKLRQRKMNSLFS